MDGIGGLMAFVAIVAGVPLALALTAATAGGALRRCRWPPGILGILLWTALVGLVFHAREEDGYYGNGTTRWEHASRFAGTGPVVLALVFAALVLAVLVVGVARPGGWSRAGIPLAILAFLGLSMAGFALTAGH